MTIELTLIAAFMIGFLGSVHCIGMCGGIVGVVSSGLPRGNRIFSVGRLWYMLGYNAGRIVSYGLAGLIAGFLGSGAYDLFPMERVGEVGLLLSGGFMILMGLYLSDWWKGLARVEAIGARLWVSIQPLSRRLLPLKTPWQAFPLGLLWGWLPCGLVYATLVWALFTASPYHSMILMLAFGAGTLPMLLLLGGAADKLNQARSNPLVRRGAGLMIIIFGVLTFLGIIQPAHIVEHPAGMVCEDTF